MLKTRELTKDLRSDHTHQQLVQKSTVTLLLPLAPGDEMLKMYSTSCLCCSKPGGLENNLFYLSCGFCQNLETTVLKARKTVT